MREGSLEAPTRHPIDWEAEDYWDEAALEAELTRVFDICHGCRRCFNLCDSFPTLFDLIDESETGELDAVDKADYARVIDGCTLCDMCYMTKCPYVPPHEFNIDFPHLMLRARAQQFRRGEVGLADRALAETDRNGKLGCGLHGLANWAVKRGNGLTRPVAEKLLGVDRKAELPRFNARRLSRSPAPARDPNGPAAARKVALFSTCFAEYNDADIGLATQAVLARQGCEVERVYPGCCGMPQLEHGDLARVAEAARKVAGALRPWIEKGHDVVAPVPSCGLMLKSEWPLLLPEDEDVALLARNTYDVSEYVVDIARKEGLAEGLQPLGHVVLHVACHARAQNMGQKGAEMLRLIPDTRVQVIERCSGHGGSWGVKTAHFETALKVGKPVARQVAKAQADHVVSECPLARAHILQGVEYLDNGAPPKASPAVHPIELMARAYGMSDGAA